MAPSGSLPPLNWLRAFEAAARLMSFTQAGRELGVTQSAISQNVRLLEAQLGQRLFHRLPHRLELTESGKAYLPAVQDGFERIGAGTREVFGPRPDQQVTVRTTPAFASLWLAPRLPELLAAEQDLRLRVISTVWDLEFESGGADLEIRYGDGQWPGVECERLTEDRIFPVAGPATATRLAADPAALAGERLLHTVGFRVTWPEWLHEAGLADRVDGGAGDHFDGLLLPLQLAERDCGVALARTSMAADRLADGRLAAPLAPALETEEAFFAVWPANATLSDDAARVLAWLRRWAAYACG